MRLNLSCEGVGDSMKKPNAHVATSPVAQHELNRSLSISEVGKRLEAQGHGPLIAAARRRLAATIAEDGPSLRVLRLSAGLSQAQLAAAVGTSQSRIARLEAGKEDPSLGFLRRLAAALDTDLNTLGAAFAAQAVALAAADKATAEGPGGDKEAPGT